MTTKVVAKANEAYNAANTSAQEALMNVRTVYSLQLEDVSCQRYAARLQEPMKAGIFQAWANGVTMGSFNGSIYCIFGLILYYGTIRVAEGYVNGGLVMNVIFAVVIGGCALVLLEPQCASSSLAWETSTAPHCRFGLGQGMPLLPHFSNGKIAAARVYEMLARQPSIDSRSEGGRKLESLEGAVELQSVRFAYPARPDVLLFDRFSLAVPAGTTMALVGPSGSGKSTVISLVERFYDPLGGRVLVDGHDIRSLNVSWLRSQIGYVNQEPVLFAATIRENLLYGRPEATQEELVAAARVARAYDFVMSLPHGFDTFVGERGLSLSGGQKQRIAIARAVLRSPRILLLDEATSALDSETEKLVQDALDELMVGRTSIVVAHRLSTIRNADCIAVVQGGQVVEKGSHDELVASRGAYHLLLQTQDKQHAVENDETESEDEADVEAVQYEEGEQAAAHGNHQRPHPGALRRSVDRVVEMVAHAGAHHRKSADASKYAPQDEEAAAKLADFLREHGHRDQAGGTGKDGEAPAAPAPPPVVKNAWRRLFELNRMEAPWIGLGVLGSMGSGATMPVFAYLLAQIIAIFFK